MALPNFRQAVSNNPQQIQGAQTMMAGSPVSFNILKGRMDSPPPPVRKVTPGWPGGYRQNKLKATAPDAHRGGKQKSDKSRCSKKNRN